MSKNKPSFDSFIDEYGAERLAKCLKVHRDTVRYWRKKYCDPRVDHMRRIQKMTRGRITYAMMIDRRPITTKGTYVVPTTKI